MSYVLATGEAADSPVFTGPAWEGPLTSSPKAEDAAPVAHRHGGLRGPSVQRLCPAMRGERRRRHIQDGAHSCTFASEVLCKQR